MPSNPYTQKHNNQFRGPSDSDKYNESSENIYEDLTFLYNVANERQADIDNGYSALVKNLYGISKEIESLKVALDAAKDTTKKIFLSGHEIEDTDRFVTTPYEVADSDLLYYDSRFRTYTLPKVLNSSISRLKFTDSNGDTSVPPSLEMVVIPDSSTIEDTGVVRTTLPYDAVISEPGKVWERNVISEAPMDQAALDLLFVLPDDLTSTEYANVINLIPFPVYDVDLVGVYYTTSVSPNLSLGSTTWTPLNVNSNYASDSDAVGYVPPGSWSGDEIIGCGPKSFVFPSTKITAIRITLRQANPYGVGPGVSVDRYIYSYGMSMLDVRYDKFESEGKMIFELIPNDTDTISSIDTVTPEIYNVAAGQIDDVFSYQIIWETSTDSGTYTTVPVPLSAKAWIEITLSKDSFGNLPALTGFQVEYS